MCHLDRDLDWILNKTPRNHNATEPYIYFLLLYSQKRIKRRVFIVDIAGKENNSWKEELQGLRRKQATLHNHKLNPD